MKTAAIAIILAAAGTAHADLVIDVVGTPGAGVTTWTFSGSGGTTLADGAVRDTTGNTFNAGDTGQFPFGLDTILNTSYQDMVFTITGNASVTVDGVTEPIAGIFLDDDGGSADDLGIRAANQLDFLAGTASSWTGSGTVNVDINDFVLGSWSINETDGQAMFLNDEVIVNFSVPAPGSLALLGLAGGLATRRRR